MSSGDIPRSESEDAAIAIAIEKAKAAEHDTLKYHLLGPSLTKAGQDSVDQQKVCPLLRARISSLADSSSRFQKSSIMPLRAQNFSIMRKLRTRTLPRRLRGSYLARSSSRRLT